MPVGAAFERCSAARGDAEGSPREAVSSLLPPILILPIKNNTGSRC